MPPPRKRLTQQERAELTANAIGRMIDAADLDSMTTIRMLLGCLACEMNDAKRNTINHEYPHEQVIAEVKLFKLNDATYVRPFNHPQRKPH